MSTQSIYTQLINAGLSKAGACGLMGNMNAESAMRANNAQDGMTKMSDSEYTAGVDNGTYTNFVRDAVGYGLCQWTYWTRKQDLYNFAKQKGVSIGDEAMQVEFAIQELKTGYPGLWNFLCTTESVQDAASRVCTEFERPAVNNIAVRSSAGLRFFEELSDDSNATPSTSDINEVVEAPVKCDLPELYKGCKGKTVKALQILLIGNKCSCGSYGADGDFGSATKAAVVKYQIENGLEDDGVVGPKTWAKLLGLG